MSLRADLDGMVSGLDTIGRLANDPVRFAHRYADPADQEIAAFLASGLAYGRVALFSPVIATLLDRADARGGPAAWVAGFDISQELPVLEPLYYRFNRGSDHVALLDGLRLLLKVHGRLGALVHLETGEVDIGPGLSRMVQAIRAAVVSSEAGPAEWSRASRGLRYLLPDPADGSTAKRMAMFARWMVRKDAVDLGLWAHIPARALVIPVDTHVHRIARLVGLTDRKTADWKTAVQLTRALAAFSPEDPVRYDFALAHLGISDGCSGAYQVNVCPRCPLQQHCVVGAAKGSA